MTKTIPNLMIFAAGLGTRMRPLTDETPKALVRVAGQPMLDRAISIARDAGIQDIIVNTHYLAGKVADHLRGRSIAISHEPALLDTGGGLKAALPGHSDPVLTMNADAVWSGPNPITELVGNWQPDDQALALLVARKDSDFAMGPDGVLSRSGDYVYTGLQLIRPTHVLSIPGDVFSLNTVWDNLIARRALRGIVYCGSWCDVGTPEAISVAERMLMADG